MTLPWFRLYGETVDDGTLRLLAFEDRWHYIAILCCKAQGILDDTNPELLDSMVGVKLGLISRELDEARRRLVKVGLIGENWQPHGWDKRQYASDTSNERTRRYREKLKAQSEEEESKSKTDTDTERHVTRDVSVTSQRSRASRVCPDEFCVTPEMRSWAREECPGIDLDRETATFKDYTFATAKTDWLKTWRNWMRKAKPVNGSRRLTKYEETMKALDAWSPHDTGTAEPPLAAIGSDLRAKVR
jgi:hypothetical protein